jgi:multiple sugar transport system permease protein
MGMPAIWSGMGMNSRRLVLHAAVYSLLILAIVIMCFPLAWMLTVSVRPNVEVMNIPPRWIPQVFTLEAYKKIFGICASSSTPASSRS